MLVREKISDNTSVKALNDLLLGRIKTKIYFFLERVSFIIRAKNRSVWFDFSVANFGQDISRNPQIKKADLIHLHWINSGFLSLQSLKKISSLGKPVVWTLHDMNTFTGGCHHAGECTNYIGECGDCRFLKAPYKNDISHSIFLKKMEIMNSGIFCFIAVSNWMAERARKSALIGKYRIEVIPNMLDVDIFKPAEKMKIRGELSLPHDKFLILFGAAKLMDKRKGYIYLLQALDEIVKSMPEAAGKLGLITFGQTGEAPKSAVSEYPQYYVKDDIAIAKLYQAADVYVTPTIEDNLPTTVMESLGCGTPVVAFNTGGIPDMVEHKKTGYLAEFKSVEDLITGIQWVQNHPHIETLSENCRRKAVDNFSPEVVLEKHIRLYKSLLS